MSPGRVTAAKGTEMFWPDAVIVGVWVRAGLGCPAPNPGADHATEPGTTVMPAGRVSAIVNAASWPSGSCTFSWKCARSPMAMFAPEVVPLVVLTRVFTIPPPDIAMVRFCTAR